MNTNLLPTLSSGHSHQFCSAAIGSVQPSKKGIDHLERGQGGISLRRAHRPEHKCGRASCQSEDAETIPSYTNSGEMPSTSSSSRGGMVDPETLYSRQNCIGGCSPRYPWYWLEANTAQEAVASERFIKGRSMNHYDGPLGAHSIPIGSTKEQGKR